MRIQDKIKAKRIARGVLEQLPVPHHTGRASTPEVVIEV